MYHNVKMLKKIYFILFFITSFIYFSQNIFIICGEEDMRNNKPTEFGLKVM